MADNPDNLNDLIGKRTVIKVFNPSNPDVKMHDGYVLPFQNTPHPLRIIVAGVVAVDARGFIAFNKRLGYEFTQSYREPLAGALVREYLDDNNVSCHLWQVRGQEDVEDWREIAKLMAHPSSTRIMP